ncbi:MAG: hypothetical protein A3H91_04355 [Gammaproteobacteria bacterium RIFCSPLOWO2_02_FULL_61_13]|nr:MAG: hypothetical protein A3H91_04355 [Gammaproteobacteria bacterium RIFCSPLOWO2_02_FULL_61_13]
MEILQKMANYVSKAPNFSVNMRAGYDAVQDSGQKVEFGETRRIFVRRPGHLRAEIEESNGDRSVIIVDGKELIAFDETHKVYAKSPIAGTVDQAIMHFVGELKMRLPLAALLLSTFPAELDRRVQALEFVEETTILGKRCDHLAARTEDVDFQAWVEKGDKPLLHRVIITYKNEASAPQFWAQLSDWNFKPALTDKQFTFAPPAGSNQIQFAAHMIRPAPADAAPQQKTGGKP